jgi:hypothetical protein
LIKLGFSLKRLEVPEKHVMYDHASQRTQGRLPEQAETVIVKREEASCTLCNTALAEQEVSPGFCLECRDRICVNPRVALLAAFARL